MTGPATTDREAWIRALRELLLVVLAAAAYGGVRAVTEGSTATAIENGRTLLRVERSLGIAWEESLQSLVLPHAWLVTLANWVYIFGHWPVIVVSAIWLYRRHRPVYRRLRNAMFLSGGIGFVFFALLPMAPPRMTNGFVDTVAERSTAYRGLQPPSLTNQVAAMPSLHFGWNLLVGIVLVTVAAPVAVRALGAVLPVAMALSVVATANHYVLDVAAGGTLVLLSLAAVVAVERRRVPTLREARDDERDRTPVRQRPRHAPLRSR
jgi:hypothetical protein